MPPDYHPFAPTAAQIRNRRPGISEILPNLFVGEYPRLNDIAWLKQIYRITAVLSLQDADDLALKGLDPFLLQRTYKQHQVEFCRVPIPDFNSGAFSLALPIALSRLEESLASEHRVFLHCNAGCNRAPTLAIAYIHASSQMSLIKARDYFEARRPCAPYMRILFDFFNVPRTL